MPPRRIHAADENQLCLRCVEVPTDIHTMLPRFMKCTEIHSAYGNFFVHRKSFSLRSSSVDGFSCCRMKLNRWRKLNLSMEIDSVDGNSFCLLTLLLSMEILAAYGDSCCLQTGMLRVYGAMRCELLRAIADASQVPCATCLIPFLVEHFQLNLVS